MTIGFSVEARYLAITPIVDPNILTQMLRQLTSSSKPPKPKKKKLFESHILPGEEFSFGSDVVNRPTQRISILYFYLYLNSEIHTQSVR